MNNLDNFDENDYLIAMQDNGSCFDIGDDFGSDPFADLRDKDYA